MFYKTARSWPVCSHCVLCRVRKNCGVQQSKTDKGGDRRPEAFSVSLPALGLVFVGGALGVFARDVLVHLLPVWSSIEWGVLLSNLVGALLIGVLVEALLEARPHTAAWLHQLFVIGVLGGFTTYSSLAFAAFALLEQGEVVAALAYVCGTVILGGLLTWLGMVLAARVRVARRGWVPRG
ncbi:MAG: CrcB family protein [Microbacteriaceae bacterium]|nr:CrcB family protein [Microbacteriaceae bacterium]